MTKIERFLNGESFYLPNSDEMYRFIRNGIIVGYLDGIMVSVFLVKMNETELVINKGTRGNQCLQLYTFAELRFKNEHAIGEPIGPTDENQLNLFLPQTN